MNERTILILIGLAVAILLALAIVWWRGYRIGFMAGIQASKDEILGERSARAQMAEVAEHCRAQWESWETKAKNYQSLNVPVLLERDRWQHLYQEQSSAHGHAQALMMSFCEYLGNKLRTAGIKFEVPAILEQVRQQYLTDHITEVTPVIQESGLGQISGPEPAEKVQSENKEPG